MRTTPSLSEAREGAGREGEPEPKPTLKAKLGIGCFVVVFATIWIGVTSVFNVSIARGVWRSFDAERRFLITNGIVSSSKLKSDSDSDGTTYRPIVTYSYTVGTASYVGTKLRAHDVATSSRDRAMRILAPLRQGATVRVYYDPRNPATSLLDPKLDGAQLFMIVFITPFNMISLMAIAACVQGWRQRGKPKPQAGVPHVDEGSRVRLHLAEVSPIYVYLGGVLVVSFLSIFIVGFATKMDPSPMEAMLTIALMVALPIGGAMWYAMRRGAGKYDLVIEHGGELVLPVGLAKKHGERIARREIRAIDVRHTHEESDGSTTDWHTPTLVLHGQSDVPIKKWQDQDKAERFAAFLRRELELVTLPAIPTDSLEGDAVSDVSSS